MSARRPLHPRTLRPGPLSICVAVTALLATSACASSAPRAQDGEPTPSQSAAEGVSTATAREFDWNGTLAAGQTLELLNINGNIDVAQGSAAEVHARIQDKGRRGADAEDIRIRVETHDGGVTVCALYPGTPDDCRAARKGSSKDHGDVQVMFKAVLPAGANLVARSVNGSIEVGSVDGQVKAGTVNGGIALAAAPNAQLETVNGSIDATLTQSGASSLETVNGKLTLTLAQGVNAAIDGETVNGGIRSDFPLTVEGGKFGPPRRVHGNVGQGGAAIELETVNGGITLRKGS